MLVSGLTNSSSAKCIGSFLRRGISTGTISSASLPDACAAAAFTVGKEQGKWLADLYLLARLRLARAGVLRVFGGGFCTYADGERFYSYRRDRVTGRMASPIWLAP